nr:HAD-IA family hydrolase [Pirellulimonas nuda]
MGSRPDRAALDLAASDIFAPIDQTWQLVRRLHAGGARMGILSNTNPTHWRIVTDGRWPILTECFEHAVLSYEARSMKPDRAIYEQAIDRAGVPAGEVFFVDDREDNIAGAIEAGLDAVVFRSAEGLERDLAERGWADQPSGGR